MTIFIKPKHCLFSNNILDDVGVRSYDQFFESPTLVYGIDENDPYTNIMLKSERGCTLWFPNTAVDYNRKQ